MMPLKTVFHSVFTKLLLVLLITGICMNILIAGFFRHTVLTPRRTAFQKNIAQYLNYLIQDLGNPPSLEKARQIGRQLSIDIRYESPDLSWTTSEALPSVDKLDLEVWQDKPIIKGRFRHHQHIIAVAAGNGWMVFSFRSAIMSELAKEFPIHWLILIITLPVIAAYLAIRYILNPLKDLSHGVENISSGNLNFELSCRRDDELGRLTDTFNQMIVRIRNMLDAKERLISDVSHELRSPLTRMKVAIEFFPNNSAKKSLKEDIDEMEKMVSELLETARLRNADHRLNFEMTDIGTLIREAAGRFADQKPGIKIGKLPDGILLNIAPEQIRIVMNNIIGNAIKYSEPEGSPVRIDMEQASEYITIRVRNRGIGIPEEDLPHIFEPFYRVDKSRSRKTGGYGLGLSLCKTIMEAHQGRIGIENTENGVVVSLFFRKSPESNFIKPAIDTP